MSPDNNGRATDSMKADLGEAGQHFKGAAVAAGDAIKGAAVAAGDEMRLGKAQMKAELADGTLSSISAAENLGAASREQVDAIMDKHVGTIVSGSKLVVSLMEQDTGSDNVFGRINFKLNSAGHPTTEDTSTASFVGMDNGWFVVGFTSGATYFGWFEVGP